MDTELILDAAYVYTAVALVVDEHGEAAAVVCTFFGAGQYEVQVSVAVGDESLHTVQAPALVGFVVGSFQHDALQVGAGIGLGQVHRHGFAGADAGNETAVLVFVTEFVQRFDTVLQRPDVAEAGIGLSHDLRTHGVGSDGEVETTVAARHGHTVQASLHHSVEVLLCTAGIFHTAVGTMRTFCVYAFCVGGNHFAGNLAGDFQYFVV